MYYTQRKTHNFLNCNFNTKENMYLYISIWLNHMKLPFL